MRKAREEKGNVDSRVYVAVSGGVDSSVSLALLKKRGFDVRAVFIKAWHPPFLSCPWDEDRHDAMTVAKQLGVPFETWDLSREYKQSVVDYMVREYKEGLTPNPDVMCNHAIKFGVFLRRALRDPDATIATGHYAQTKANTDGTYSLLTSKDKNKDQTYFLWTLGQKELASVHFPVGGMTKPEVRKTAEAFMLPTAKKKESQGLCFMGKIDLKRFLKHYIDVEKGDVVNEKGEKVGEHDGVSFYTVGERRGFTIAKKTPYDKPIYIVAKEIASNTLIVSSNPSKSQFIRRDLSIRHCNWIQGKPPLINKPYSARVRYRQELQECAISLDGGAAVVHFKSGQEHAADGQSLVIYDGEECIGGGIIQADHQ